ncbi:MAG: hypothetical protein NW224_03850 [Leptolyngbyaceae cyanobacterium bins.302]|nr:hypothetical protein [Leptolyngbyaceae cyanobacterium bins.302]
MIDRLKNLPKRLFAPGRSLLIPMLILAAGFHAALLAMPIPSTEALKEADDKKSPITVNQIPTEQPANTTRETSTGTVDVPAMASPTASNSASASDTSTGTSTASTDSSNSEVPSSAIAQSTSTSTKSTTRSTASASDASDSASSSDPSDTPTGSESSNSDAPAETSSSTTATVATNGTRGNTATSPFTDFPHYQPSEADCYGLGFGDNCRVVETQEIGQVAEFFKQELKAKDFIASLVNDEPNRKVFKIVKDNKTLFLNIWKGKDKVSYLLSRVVVKQSPEEIKIESEK